MRLTDIVTTEIAFVRPVPDVPEGRREALPASLPKPVKLTRNEAPPACTRSRDRRRAQ